MKKHTDTLTLALYPGIAAAIIGLFTFVISWNLYEYFDGPMPGYRVLLWPGNLSLIYFWHPLFTEEIPLLPKLMMIILGQFVLAYLVSALLITFVRCRSLFR